MKVLVADKIKIAIQSRLRDAMAQGATYLASERELAQELNVSRAPVRAALAELERKGMIRREHGVGTRIIENKRVERKLFTVGVVFSDGGNASVSPEFSGLLTGVSSELTLRRLPAMFCPSAGYVSRALGTDATCGAKKFSEILAQRVQAVVFIEWPQALEVGPVLEQMGIPSIVANLEDDADLTAIMVDYESLGRQAAQHLKRCGYERVWIVTGGRNRYLFKQFHAGFVEVWGEQPFEWLECVSVESMAHDKLVDGMSKMERPQAVFTFGAARTCGAMAAFKRLGLSVPEDIGLLCFNRGSHRVRDMRVTGFISPAVRMGELAASTLSDMYAGNSVSRITVLQSRFVDGITLM